MVTEFGVLLAGKTEALAGKQKSPDGSTAEGCHCDRPLLVYTGSRNDPVFLIGEVVVITIIYPNN